MNHVSRRDLVGMAGLGLLAAGCGLADKDPRPASKGGPGSSPTAAAATPKLEDVAVTPPKDLTQPLLSSDLLIFSKHTLSESTLDRI
jgi:hypothetical protein